MATALAVASGTLGYTQTSFSVTKRAADLRSAGAAARRLNVLRVSRIAGNFEAVFCGVKAAMAGKEMLVGETEGRSASACSNLLVVGPGVLGSLVGQRWLQVGCGANFLWLNWFCIGSGKYCMFKVSSGIRLWTRRLWLGFMISATVLRCRSMQIEEWRILHGSLYSFYHSTCSK